MKNERGPLRFRGAPTRLTATFCWPAAGMAANAGQVTLPGPGPVPLSVRRLRGAAPAISVLSFRLPRSTKPGAYEGSVSLGDIQLPIVADVEAQPRLRFLPHSLTLQARAGAKIATEVMLINQGNVDISAEPEYTFCVFDHRGIDLALFRSLTEEDSAGNRRIDRLMDELAESHGGLVRVTIGEKVVRIAPEETRELEIGLHFSRRLRPFHTYFGAWILAGASFSVEVETIGEGQTGGRRR
jgi:hypothetical protein